MVKVVPKVINQQPQVQVCPLALVLSVATEGVGEQWNGAMCSSLVTGEAFVKQSGEPALFFSPQKINRTLLGGWRWRVTSGPLKKCLAIFI